MMLHLHHVWMFSLALALGACAHQFKPASDWVLPKESVLQDAFTNQETWYQAEWFWQDQSVAFLAMLRPQSDGSTVLVATTLTGQELFSLQRQGQNVVVLEQRPETKRIPLAYIYRDLSWLTTDEATFNTMSMPASNSVHATSHERVWHQHGNTIWQAMLQTDGAWWLKNNQAGYQLRLLPLTQESQP